MLLLFLLPLTLACKTAIIGAGIGGSYSAFRLSTARPRSTVCIFEAKTRPGGRILTVHDPLPSFRNYTIDLGAYRFHRAHHRLVRIVSENVLNISNLCYTDPLDVEPQCPPFVDRLFSTRGKVLGSLAGKSAQEVWRNERKLPYVLGDGLKDEKGRVDLEGLVEKTLIGPTSFVPEIAERIVELVLERDYGRAMGIVDEILGKMRSGRYRGSLYSDVSYLQMLVAEGFTAEELQLVFDTSFAANYAARWSLLYFSALFLREIALEKDVQGLNFYVTPAERRDGVLRRIGMGSIVQKLLEESEKKSVKVMYGKKVTSVSRVGGGKKMRLRFRGGGSVVVDEVVMNVGKPDLMAMGLESEPLNSASDEFLRAVERNFVVGQSKVYCFWEDAWWITKLKTTDGRIRAAGETFHFLRYHDGHVTCKNREKGRRCRGGLLVSFNSGDSSGVGSAIHVHTHNDMPYTPLTNTDNVKRLIPGQMSGVEEMFFNDTLSQIRKVHSKSLKEVGLGADAIPRPTGCVMGDWRDVGVHTEMGPGRGKTNIYKLYTRPVKDLKLALVNEGWSSVQSWSEGSLQSAERALFHTFGLDKPAWLDEPFYESVIRRFNQGA